MRDGGGMSDDACLEMRVGEERMITEGLRQRPFILLRPEIYPDGNLWCVLYGKNLQEGVAGFGASPHLASLDFDRAWFSEQPMGARINQGPGDPALLACADALDKAAMALELPDDDGMSIQLRDVAANARAESKRRGGKK